MAENPKGRLESVEYRPPEHPGAVQLDIVTPTCNRPNELKLQAECLAPQLQPGRDRWIVVEDAAGIRADPRELIEFLPTRESLLFVQLSYVRKAANDTVNFARFIGCSAARPDAWIVEADDHDLLHPLALQSIRETICRGALFIYGDALLTTEDGQITEPRNKSDYEPGKFAAENSEADGTRAFPSWLYRAVGGHRWSGPKEPGGNEFPSGDYGLALRVEAFTGGQGIYRIPQVLCRIVRATGSISIVHGQAQFEMAQRLRAVAQAGEILNL